MYFHNFHSLYPQQKQPPKCNKIFRPWDVAETKPNKLDSCGAQDATISTTTNENDDKEEKPQLLNAEPSPQKKELNPLEHNQNFAHEKSDQRFPPAIDYPGSLENWTAYPEFVHLNLAHSLGLTPSDPLFLECVNQGYTLEEYTRVLTQEQQAKILNSRKQRPKKYRCPHCDVGFSNNGQLKGHIRIHTGERPFRCDETNCGKTFTRNEELTRHKRIHSGLRPFPCTHCGKRFGRKDHLKKHSRTHFQPRGLYAVPVMLPYETWSSSTPYPYVPMFTY